MRNKVSNISTIEMVRSDVSGKLFPSDECEMVIIKVVKHKEESINDYSPFPIERSSRPVIAGLPSSAIKSVPDNTNSNLASDEGNKRIQITHSIIPPAMRDLFNDPNKL